MRLSCHSRSAKSSSDVVDALDDGGEICTADVDDIGEDSNGMSCDERAGNDSELRDMRGYRDGEC